MKQCGPVKLVFVSQCELLNRWSISPHSIDNDVSFSFMVMGQKCFFIYIGKSQDFPSCAKLTKLFMDDFYRVYD